jgi:lysophospholipase L1-like esterase
MTLLRLAASVAVLGCASWAQGSDTLVQRLEERLEAQQRLLHDWAGLIRYGSENTEVRPPAAGELRVVFIGDEHTERWGGEESSRFFPGKAYYNRGIAGQTSAQMLLRFRQDVISLRPKVVVIEAGTNDLAGLTGPATQYMTGENILSMMDLSKANGIGVVLASVPPVCDCTEKQTQRRPVGKIMAVNEWLKDQAAASGAVYLDFSPVLGGRTLKREMTVDGFLLNDAAYVAMEPLAERAIAAAAAGKK